MAEGSYGEKTEAATPRKREEARKQGNFAQSHDLTGAVALAAGLVMLSVCGPWLLHALLGFMHTAMSNLHQPHPLLEFLRCAWLPSFLPVALALLTILASVMAATLGYLLLQGGFHVNTEVLGPKWERIDPMAGFARLFSFQVVVQGILGLAKLVAVSWIAFLILSAIIPSAPLWAQTPLQSLFLLASQLSMKLSWSVAVPLLVLGVADYAYRRWRFEKDLMMTKEEAKEEHRQLEGDPMIKARIRQIRLERAKRRMIAAVPDATVVVTNPTHVAVALRYEAGVSGAPVVVAKGEHKVAERIKALAAQHAVPIIEKPALARALLRSVDIGQEIPLEFYRVVAEVLALVYRQQGRLAGRPVSQDSELRPRHSGLRTIVNGGQA